MKKIPVSLLRLIFQAVCEALIGDQEEDIEVDPLLLVIFKFLVRRHPEREVADYYVREMDKILEDK